MLTDPGQRPANGHTTVEPWTLLPPVNGCVVNSSEWGEMAQHGSSERSASRAAPLAGNAVDAVRSVLLDLIGEVIKVRRAHAGYAVFARMDTFVRHGYAHDDVYESFVGTALVLAVMSSEAAAAAGRDRTQAVAWVRENLGAWASDAAARVAPTLEAASSTAAPNPDWAEVQVDLGEHVLPAILWLIAGIGAVASAGDEDWLRRVSDS